MPQTSSHDVGASDLQDVVGRWVRVAGAVLLAVSLACASTAWCAFVTVGGSNFDLQYDDAQLGIQLFGTPTLSGNTVFFTPSSFIAQSLNGAGMQTATADVSFQLVAHDRIVFGQMSLTERGDYLLGGVGSTVSLSGSLSATGDSSGPVVSAPILVGASTPLTMNDGNLNLWRAGAALDISAGLGDVGLLSVTIENTLSASTQPGVSPSAAFIQKKFTGDWLQLRVLPTDEIAVPEPSGSWLLTAGLLSFAALVARRRKWRLSRQSGLPLACLGRRIGSRVGGKGHLTRAHRSNS